MVMMVKEQETVPYEEQWREWRDFVYLEKETTERWYNSYLQISEIMLCET